MKFELKTSCDFRDVFEIGEDKKLTHEQPGSRVGHIRADHDGYRWWTNYIPYNEELKSKEIKEEIEAVGKYLIETEFVGKGGRDKLFDYCHSHPEAIVKEGSDEYNFFINGDYAYFWIRVNARLHDYQLYVHICAKNLYKRA